MLYNNHLTLFTRLKLAGFSPNLIIDCGSAMGKWSKLVNQFFPQTTIAAFDIIDYTRGDVYKIPQCQFRTCILSNTSEPDFVYFNQDYPERTSICRDILFLDSFLKLPCNTTTLDYMIPETFEGPYLLKLDTQGSELKILEGASRVLKSTEIIIMEVSTISGNENSPEFTEVIYKMNELGFVLYNIFESGNPEEYIAQFDAVFVTKDHTLRNVYKKVIMEESSKVI